jgi:glutathione S-transferase
MKLHARRTSCNSQKVLWFLGELGLDYEFIATGGDAGGLDTQAYRALNPNGRVPTWQDEHGALWESHAILRYLAAAYAPEVWWSRDAAERGRVERWMDWSQAGFDVAFMTLFWGYWRTPVAERNKRLIELQNERCRSSMAILDGVLKTNTFLAGDSLTLADIPVGSLMYRYVNLDITSELPSNVARWYERLMEREPFRTHVMLPFDDLKGRLAF